MRLITIGLVGFWALPGQVLAQTAQAPPAAIAEPCEERLFPYVQQECPAQAPVAPPRAADMRPAPAAREILPAASASPPAVAAPAAPPAAPPISAPPPTVTTQQLHPEPLDRPMPPAAEPAPREPATQTVSVPPPAPSIPPTAALPPPPAPPTQAVAALPPAPAPPAKAARAATPVPPRRQAAVPKVRVAEPAPPPVRRTPAGRYVQERDDAEYYDPRPRRWRRVYPEDGWYRYGY